MKEQNAHCATFAAARLTYPIERARSRHTLQGGWHLESCSQSRAVHSFDFSSSTTSPRRSTRRIQQLLESVQLLERAVPTHMLVLRIAASFITFDGSSAAARAGDVESALTVPRIQSRRLRWTGRDVWRASNGGPCASNMFDIYTKPHPSAMGSTPIPAWGARGRVSEPAWVSDGQDPLVDAE